MEHEKTKNLFSVDEMETIRQSILRGIDGDEEGTALFHRLLEKSIRYATIRAGWGMLSADEKAETDSARTSAHDSVITHFNMLARYLVSKEKDTAWRDLLGDPATDPYNRKRIGDEACYIVFAEALKHR